MWSGIAKKWNNNAMCPRAASLCNTLQESPHEFGVVELPVRGPARADSRRVNPCYVT